MLLAPELLFKVTVMAPSRPRIRGWCSAVPGCASWTCFGRQSVGAQLSENSWLALHGIVLGDSSMLLASEILF